MEEERQDLTYRRQGSFLVAYEGRQAIWEAENWTKLAEGLRAKGYDPSLFQHDPIRIVIVR